MSSMEEIVLTRPVVRMASPSLLDKQVLTKDKTAQKVHMKEKVKQVTKVQPLIIHQRVREELQVG